MVGIDSRFTVRSLDWNSQEIEIWRSWCDQAVVSPFQTPAYLRIYTEHFLAGVVPQLLCVLKDNQPIAFVGLVIHDQKATALGMQLVDGAQEISDYFNIVSRPHSSLDEVHHHWQAILFWLRQQGVTSVQIDYLSDQTSSFEALQHFQLNQNLGHGVQLATVTLQEVAPRIALPNDWQIHVASLKKKYRDELKRKLKRIEQAQPLFEFNLSGGTTTDDFIRLHRLSDAAKQHFMTENMADFFHKLATVQYEGGWQWRYGFVSLAGLRVAGVAYFERQGDALLLYNSGYDPAYRQWGVGFSLVANLLKFAIDNNYQIFDFMRGSERYKYELGGVSQQLWRIQIQLV